MAGKFLMAFRRWSLILLLVLLAAGCASQFPYQKKYRPLPQSSTCRMAVLPFEYNGDFVNGSDIVTKSFSSVMASTPGFDLLPEGDVQHFYREQKLFPLDQPDEELIKTLAQRYDLQYVIVGDILAMSEINSALDVKTAMTIVISLRNGATGELLSTTYHRRTGEEYRKILHFGLVNSVTGLSRRMASEIVEIWKENGMDQCDH